jgi:hypothetical protein
MLIVIYSSTVLISLYFFNIASVKSNHGLYYDIIGLIQFDKSIYFSFFVGLFWHLLIFVFSSIQLQLIKEGKKNINLENINEISPKIYKIIMIIFDWLNLIFMYYGLWICYIVIFYHCLFTTKITIINLIFLVLIFISMILSVIIKTHSWKLVAVFIYFNY